MNLMMNMLEHSSVAAVLGYDVLASEIHHRGKKDSPSGTMKSLLQILQAQGNKNIQVQSARVGDEKGTHTISFFSDDEELTLTHRVNHRRVFAKGALIAARFIAGQERPGLYSFQDMEKL
jgi:4-hydroxy-tetrahydrodipicolinate reductase